MAGENRSAVAPPVRAAEIAAALCLATDLGMRFPWTHGLRATVATMRLCDLAGADEDTRRQAYFLSLLLFVGCTADSAQKARLFGGPITESIVEVIWGERFEQARVVLRTLPDPGVPRALAAGQAGVRLPRALAQHRHDQLALCEVAQHMARQLGLGPLVAGAMNYLTDRWDGAGVLHRARGDELPLALRLALVARDASYQATLGGPEHAADVVSRRAGKAHDPRLTGLLVRHAREVLESPAAGGDESSEALHAQVIAAEPGRPVLLADDELDGAVAMLGEVADLVSPSWAGRSREVAQLAASAAEAVGLDPPGVADVRHAALLQDVGRISVQPQVWERRGRLAPHEWEQVRLHPYYTERVCSGSAFLRRIGAAAACHHERLDGSGYHRGTAGAALGAHARLLAAADALATAREASPESPGLDRSAAAARVAGDVAAGRLDARAVAAVVEASGVTAPPLPRPAGLTEREVQVLGLIARGHATKQVARVLGISPKTADQHVQHVYRKIGTSSRAAAALFAAEHGLLG